MFVCDIGALGAIVAITISAITTQATTVRDVVAQGALVAIGGIVVRVAPLVLPCELNRLEPRLPCKNITNNPFFY